MSSDEKVKLTEGRFDLLDLFLRDPRNYPPWQRFLINLGYGTSDKELDELIQSVVDDLFNKD